MQVKLLSHVVEEMTSLSKVFRAHQVAINEQPLRKIPLRPLYEQVDEPIEPHDDTYEKSLQQKETKLQERSQALQEREEELEKSVEDAQRQIEQLKVDWENEREQLKEEAYREGYEYGVDQGHQDALEQMQQSIQLANEITSLSKVNSEKYLASQERVILELSVAIAEKIIGEELKQTEEVYLSMIRRAIKEAQETDEIKLYISPKYFELVSSNRDELETLFPPDIPFLIFANEDFADEECYIETNHGRIEVTIDTQLKELKKQLVAALESGDDE